jgi:hypothetical protein
VAITYDVFAGYDLAPAAQQQLEDFINDEIAKRGLADRAKVQVSPYATLLSFIPSWDTELNDAVEAGIKRFEAGE